MAERDRDNVYFATMAIASVVMGTIGVVLTLALRPASTEAGLGNREVGPTPLSVDIPKVHYEDSQVLVQVRNPGEWRELREFVQPDNPALTRFINGALYG